MIERLHFAYPYLLPLGGCGALALAATLHVAGKNRLAKLERFAAARLLSNLVTGVNPTLRQIKILLLASGVFCLFLALARPQYGYQWMEMRSRGIDLIFALDTSKSMLTRDLRPSRLQRARFAILDFLQTMKGDRVGLLPFAGSAYLMCPLTLDYRAFAETLNEVNTDIIPTGGTNLAAVIDSGLQLLKDSSNHKILILLTDGENLQGDAIEAARRAAAQDLTIFTVGVGTPGGELIPAPDGHGFIKDAQGRFVTSKLDEATLKKIAEITNGLYLPLDSSGAALETIYQQRLSGLTKDEREERRRQVPIERYQWPLALAGSLLLIEMLLTENRKRTRTRGIWKRMKAFGGIRKAVSIFLVLAMFSNPLPTAQASPGEEAYARQKYLEASEYYRKRLEKEPDNPVLQYNYGTTAYRNNMFDDAIEAFNKALKNGDVKLQESVYYNLGNSYFAKGKLTKTANPQATIQAWQEALKSYDGALRLNPEDRDASHNREVVKKLLETLEKQQNSSSQQRPERDGQNSTDKKTENSLKSRQKSQQKPEPGEQGKDTSEQNSKPSRPAGQEKKESSAGNTTRQTDSQAAEGTQDDGEQSGTRPEHRGERKPDGKPGILSREEAKQLLDSLEGEEGLLNFLPRSNGDDTPIKDW